MGKPLFDRIINCLSNLDKKNTKMDHELLKSVFIIYNILILHIWYFCKKTNFWSYYITYQQNKQQQKTQPLIRPIGCLVTILSTEKDNILNWITIHLHNFTHLNISIAKQNKVENIFIHYLYIKSLMNSICLLVHTF